LWTSRLLKGSTVNILLSPEVFDFAVEQLSARSMTFWVLNEDVQQALDEERRENEMAQQDGRIVGTFARYADIEAWLQTKAAQCGNNCVLTNIGKTTEGRNMYVFRYGLNIKTGAVLKRIFSESSLHAREWLAQAAHIYIVDQIVSKFGTDSTITSAFTKYEINFVIVGNPDGYEWSHTNDRMWRKTRAINQNSACKGVDPNRNFDYFHCGEGTSTSPCSDTYCGTKPFSEPETLAISNYITANKANIKGYIAQHTFCQMILIPYGYTYPSVKPSDYNELLSVANSMGDAMRVATGKRYTVGNSADLLYAAAGASDDWAKGVAGVKYAYTIELRPTCNTPNGFIVNPSEIAPAGTELLAAITTMTSVMV